MKTCGKCSTTNPDDAKFCRNCGRNLVESSDSGVLKSVLSALALVVIAACIIIFVTSRSSDPTPDYPPVETESTSTTTETPVEDYNDSGTSAESDNTTSSDYGSTDSDTSSSDSEPSASIYRMVEVCWTAPDYTVYRGLIVIMNDFVGLMKVVYYHSQYGSTSIIQKATLTNYTDGSSIINCDNPRGDYASTYSPDNFKIFPNGLWYTQDNNGVWTMAIVATSVSPSSWSYKLSEYGLN